MEKFEQKHINRMKKYLPILRKAAGWKAEDLGELIGVTRQTITSLEKNPDYKMTKTQYIALRSVFYREAILTKNDRLKYLVDLLILKDDLTEQEKNQINATVEKISADTGRSVNSAAVWGGLAALLGAMGYTLGSSVAGTLAATSMIKRSKNK